MEKRHETLTEDEIRGYTEILKQELKAALGCTEPISIAYGAAYARKLLGHMPETCEIFCSGNIIKNVKAVTVPGTGGLKGIETAVLAGAICNRPELGMEVLSGMTEENREELRHLLDSGMVKVRILDTEHPLHFILKMQEGEENVSLEIIDSHMQIGKVTKNGKRYKGADKEDVQADTQKADLSLKKILVYAQEVDLEDIRIPLEKQISCNMAIAREGLKNYWGAGVGQVLSKRGTDIYTHMCAAAAAGSDARMNGCPLPVVINSGSGNQGLTVSVPVVLYAQYCSYTKDRLLRALCVSNLTAIHQKERIGKLSAFCGATSAAAGAVCGVAYLDGAGLSMIEQTLVNAVANVGGMVCDGAKSSCAAKISTALYSALLGYELAKQEKGFCPGEGIVGKTAEETIANIGRMAAEGMRSTDKEILQIMLEE